MFKEKSHRLPRKCYCGEISVAFTLCLKGEIKGFIDPQVVNQMISILTAVATKADCIVSVYCFMPDHQHLILTGTSEESSLYKTIILYKQKTGFWSAKNRPNVIWQKDFYDHVIRTNENLSVQIQYILDNPVRKGLCSTWQEYPYKGAIGCNLDNMLEYAP